MPLEGNSEREEYHAHSSMAAPNLPQAQEHGHNFLCDNCKKIDWSALATNDLIINGETDRKLRPLNETFEELRDSCCKICRILSIIKPASLDGHPCVLKAITISSALHGLGGDARTFRLGGSSEDTLLSIWIKDAPLVINLGSDHRYLGLTKPREGAYEWEAIKILPSSIDFSYLKELTEVCAENHPDCSLSARLLDNIPSLKAIDVTKEPPEITCISDSDKRQPEYVALSYVWGKGPEDSPPAGLVRPLPLIRDAITVTKAMGYNYLWIDRFCIPQDPSTDEQEKEKGQMISQMDRIYRKASITIIAAAGGGPDQGLPGVSSFPRRTLKEVNIDGVNIFELPGKPYSYGSQDLMSSKWDTRGWTYQEAFLSRRRLIFTEGQVIYLCNELCAQECVRLSRDRSLRISGHLTTDKFGIEKFIPGLLGNRRSLALSIEEYSRRELTYDSDALDAFRGILNHYTYELGDADDDHLVHLFCGLIATRGGDKKWRADLLWHHLAPTTRRQGLPSWSWLGWGRGGHLYCGMNSVWLRSKHWEISSLDGDGRVRSLHDLAEETLAEVRQTPRPSLAMGQTRFKPELCFTTCPVLPVYVRALKLSDHQDMGHNQVETPHSNQPISRRTHPFEDYIGALDRFFWDEDIAFLEIGKDLGIQIGLRVYWDQQVEKEDSVLALPLGIDIRTCPMTWILVRKLPGENSYERVGCSPSGDLYKPIFLDENGRILDKPVELPPWQDWILKMAERKDIRIV